MALKGSKDDPIIIDLEEVAQRGKSEEVHNWFKDLSIVVFLQ